MRNRRSAVAVSFLCVALAILVYFWLTAVCSSTNENKEKPSGATGNQAQLPGSFQSALAKAARTPANSARLSTRRPEDENRLEEKPSVGDYHTCSETVRLDDNTEVTLVHDGDCEGPVRRCNWQVFDDDGSSVLSFARDNGCNGEPEACHYSTYDDRGLLEKIAIDGRCEGRGTFDICFSHEFDAEGNEVALVVDINCRGRDFVCNYFVYDDLGRKVVQIRDEACSGSGTVCINFEYDEHDELIAKTEDQGCTGIPTECTYFTYHLDGSEAEQIRDPWCVQLLQFR